MQLDAGAHQPVDELGDRLLRHSRDAHALRRQRRAGRGGCAGGAGRRRRRECLRRHEPGQDLRAQDGLRRRGDDEDVRHRALHELGARALEDQAPARQDAERGRHAVDLVEQVAGDHDGDALAGELDQQPAHLLDTGRVQAVGGLIEDEQLGLAGQRQSDPEALLHAQ